MSPRHAHLTLVTVALAASLAGCGGSSGTTESTSVTTATTTHQTTTSPATTTRPTATTATTTEAAPKVTTITIRVVDGTPDGGIARPSVEHDERVVLVVKSDTADEVHLHGYDLSTDVAAGGTARLAFTATIRGRFDVELENTGVQLAEITVR